MSDSAGRLAMEMPRSGAARLSTDDRLARRAAGGDERAFAAIYKRHHQELVRYCRAILRDPDDAQDALQATMVKALRALPGEEREIALKPWLFRIAHNEAINIIRSREGLASPDLEAPDPRAEPEFQAATRERLRELVRDLDQLPERQRGSLVMRELSGLSFEEISGVFSCSPAAAKQAVYEARIALQEIAEGREMECNLVREAISAHDRRVLRGRRIRAHLRGCRGCSEFEAAIGRRRSDFAALAPPLAAPAAIATLQAVLGGSAGSGAAVAGAGAGAGALGAGIGAGSALKVAVAVLATATIAGGGAELSGVLDRDGSGDRGRAAPAAPAEPPAVPADEAGGGSSDSAPGATGGGDGAGADRGQGHGAGHGNGGRSHGNGGGHGQATAPGQTGSPGNSASAPGQTGSPGNSASAPGQSGTTGNSATAPGQTGANPGQSGTTPGQTGSAGSSATAPGQTGTSPGQLGTTSGEAASAGQESGAGAATAPGQTGSAGNSADAPGDQKSRDST